MPFLSASDQKHSPPNLILASASPRRLRLLQLMGLNPKVLQSAINEDEVPGDSPEDFAQNAAREKCIDVAQSAEHGSLVLAADTVVCVRLDTASKVSDIANLRIFEREGEAILGKPGSPAEAARMLALLSNRAHRVITGVALCCGGKVIHVSSETTTVWFRRLSPDEIDAYCATGEPLDKAGAYGIQGIAAEFVEKIEGDLSNVIGLPLPLIARFLEPWFSNLHLPEDRDLREEGYRPLPGP